MNNYISVYTKDQQIITYMSLKEIIGVIPEELFCRVHRSYIVSLAHIRFVDGREIFINNRAIPISESYKAHFFARINNRYL